MKNNNESRTAAAPETTEGEAITIPDKATASVEIIPFGTTDRIRLSAAIVRQMIATRTRTGKEPDDNQCIKFIMLCKARHLNPFEGDAFMLGYDTQAGPQWSLITAHQVFLKRAEASKGFTGLESGVIIKGEQGGIMEREGDLVYDEERLMGGWAKVYRKDREKPFYKRLKLATFNTGVSRWVKDPAGMIVKCAEADALRTAFPTHLGGLYVEEEIRPIDVTPSRLEIKRAKVPVPELTDITKLGSQGAMPGEQLPEKTSGDAMRSALDKRETTAEATQELLPTPDEPEQKKTAEPLTPKKKGTRSAKKEPESPGLLPFATEMLGRLKLGNKTPEHLLRVAVANEWCTPDETWPLPEEKLERFLNEDNWLTIMEELDALK